MGAYYTKEDITEYISKNTIIPFLFDRAQKLCANAFDAQDGIWKLLREQPDRYIYDAVKHGVTVDAHERPARQLSEPTALPTVIAAGLDDVSKRTEWNKTASAECGLPTETWREVVARRKRYEEVRAKLVAGEVTQINDLITLNLDIRQFAQDVLETYEGSDLIMAFYRVISGRIPEKSKGEFEEGLSVLDPTCGSGAFLFAALNVLEPLVRTCIKRMHSFVEEADQKGHTAAHPPFRRVLTEVGKHLNAEYFVLKSIIVGNLYGVDIMQEATEICKLRLFLKLVAHVERDDRQKNMGLEPLPDIDFNIRAGNTLVGFASLNEMKNALTAQLDFSAGETLRQIEEGAREADRAYKRFRQIQTVYDYKDETQPEFKGELRRRLDVLAERLDRYLAEVYGKDPHKQKDFEAWRKAHQPFHWFTEFYGINTSGGFDVIIGNPPYVEYGEVKKDYTIRDYVTKSCGNLYAFTWERCIQLNSHNGRVGMIVPVASVCTDGYAPLQSLLRKSGSTIVSNFNDRPSKLFDGLEHIRLSIILLHKQKQSHSVFSSAYNKWQAAERDTLFQELSFIENTHLNMGGAIAKLGCKLEVSLLKKFNREAKTLPEFANKLGRSSIYYTRKLSHFVQILDFIPKITDEKNKPRHPSELKELNFGTDKQRDVFLSILNSNLFYWLLTVYSDCRNLNKREVHLVRFDANKADPKIIDELSRLRKELMRQIKETSKMQKMGKLTIQCTFPKYAKPIIDDIDRVLAAYYGFTDEELDFVINYDIKYRMGSAESEE